MTSSVAKRVLQIAMLNVAGALSQSTDEPNDGDAWFFKHLQLFAFLFIFAAFLTVVLFMVAEVNSSSSSEAGGETGPRNRSMLLPYRFLSEAFGRLRRVMMFDHQHLGRGFAILQHLVEMFREFENGENVAYNLSFLSTMRHSISDMERGMDFRISDDLAIMDDGLNVFERTVRGMPVMEPDPEVPSIADSEDIPMVRGDIPNPGEPHSPEHMASWMAGELLI